MHEPDLFISRRLYLAIEDYKRSTVLIKRCMHIAIIIITILQLVTSLQLHQFGNWITHSLAISPANKCMQRRGNLLFASVGVTRYVILLLFAAKSNITRYFF